MSREVHVRFWEHAEVRFLRVTRHNRANGTAILTVRTWGYSRREPGES